MTKLIPKSSFLNSFFLEGVKIETRVIHEIFMIIRCLNMLFFKLYVSQLAKAYGDGGGGGLTKFLVKIGQNPLLKPTKHLKGDQFSENYGHGPKSLLMAV